MQNDGIRVDLAELIALRLRAGELARIERHRSADRLSGAQSSPFRGRGMEYAESRPYAPGDDVRHIDWRVTARTGRTHTKLFQPERERATAVVYDSSPTMGFGTRVCFKSVQAARLGALMVWAALADGDRLAAAVCGHAREVIRPLGGRRGALRALDALVRWQPPHAVATKTALGDTLDLLRRSLRPGSHLLLVVDPRSVDESAERALMRLRAHHDLVACVVVDALEAGAPPPAQYQISDGSRQQRLDLESSDSRMRWRRHFEQRHVEVMERLRRGGARARVVLTSEDPVHALHELLRGSSSSGVAA